MKFWLRALFVVLLAMAPGWVRAQDLVAAADPVVIHVVEPRLPERWERVDEGFVSVYGPQDQLPLLMHLAHDAAGAVPGIADTLGVPIGGTIHVVVAPDDASFHALQPGRVPEWADGTAWPDAGHIYLRRPRTRTSERPLGQVLRHEIVHVLLGRAYAPATPPRWLQEGVATVLSGEYGPEMSMALQRAVAMGHEPSLQALEDGFPAGAARAQIAYAESADFIAWFRETYGDDALAALVLEGARGQPMSASVRAVTGEFLDDVEPSWRHRLTNSSLRWTALLSTWEIWTGLAGVVGMVGLVLARRRSNRRLEAMRQEEARLDALLRSLWQRDPTVH